jgi:hypothetical protein
MMAIWDCLRHLGLDGLQLSSRMDGLKQPGESLDKGKPLDLAAERDLAISFEADVEDSLADVMPIETNAGVVVGFMGCFSGLSGAV